MKNLSLFKKQLNSVLDTPQGIEIKKRNARVSEQYKGGHLRHKKSGFQSNGAEFLEPPLSKADIDVLSKLEESEQPLLKRIPPMLPPQIEKKEPLPAIIKEAKESSLQEVVLEQNVDEKDTEELEPRAQEEMDLLTKDALKVFRDEFRDCTAKEDYFNAMIVLITASLVLFYHFMKVVGREASTIIEFLLNQDK